MNITTMKTTSVGIVLSVVCLQVFARTVFDEKSDALKEVNAKLKEVENFAQNVLKAIETERTNINPTNEEELKNILEIKTKDTRLYMDEYTENVIKEAIVKGKPVSVIHCIREVATAGSARITDEYNVSLKKIYEVKNKKLKKIEFDEYAVNAILKGLRNLAEQSIRKINQNDSTIQAVKAEFLSNAKSAMTILGDIEVDVHEPILSKEYIKTRQEIEKRLTALAESLKDEVNQCLDK